MEKNPDRHRADDPEDMLLHSDSGNRLDDTEYGKQSFFRGKNGRRATGSIRQETDSGKKADLWGILRMEGRKAENLLSGRVSAGTVINQKGIRFIRKFND